MVRTYDLRKDEEQIARIQKPTLNTDEFGIQQTHGLYGSKEWWLQIGSGALSTHTLEGTISKVYMGSMGDWPEIEVTDSEGGKSQWTREVNRLEDNPLYVVGKRIKISYVIQKHKEKSWDGGSETKCVIQIEVEG